MNMRMEEAHIKSNEDFTNIGRMLREEEITHKRNLSGVRGRASRTGKKKWLSQIDLMNKAEKKSYSKAGIVHTFKEGEHFVEILYEDFLKIEEPKSAQNALLSLVKENSDAEAAAYWGIPEIELKSIRRSLGIIKGKKGKISEIKDEIEWPIIKESPKINIDKPKKALMNETSFSIFLKGEFYADTVLGRLDAVRALFAVTPKNKYKINIEIEEI